MVDEARASADDTTNTVARTTSVVDESTNTSVEAQDTADRAGRFGFDLYQALRDDPSFTGANVIFSPHSAFVGLAMVHEGARGETAEQIRSVMYLPTNLNEVRRGFTLIDRVLHSSLSLSSLETADTLWPAIGYPILPEYVQTIQQIYQAGVQGLDYGDALEAARTINRWVADATHGRIDSLVSSDSLGPLTRAVLTNAVYFNGEWEELFLETTEYTEFQLESDMEWVHTPLMRTENHYAYTDHGDCQMVRLPYTDGVFAMYVILPCWDEERDDGRGEIRLADVEDRFDLDTFREFQDQLLDTEGTVVLPEFSFRLRLDLRRLLEGMGVTDVFNTYRADLSGISEEPGFFVEHVLQEATITVDRMGTEAAAALESHLTGGVESSWGRGPFEFIADHPFMFVIQHESTGTILFIGRVYDPR